MIVVQSASTPKKGKDKSNTVGLAIAGGGPIGGMYELGVLRALDDALEGIDLGRLHVYVGVSSGSFLAAGLANGISTAQMCEIFICEGSSSQVQFSPQRFLRPAFYEYFRSVSGIPRMLKDWVFDMFQRSEKSDASDIFGRLGTLVPTGMFDSDGIEEFLREVFQVYGRTNDFRKLQHQLNIIAVNLNSGEIARFGADGLDHIPISRAVQASAALPGLYPPVEIEGQFYVDGALRRTLHASVALDQGVDLVIGLNPLVPFDTGAGAVNDFNKAESLMEGGLPAVLSQSFRTLLKSRMQVGLDKYQKDYPHADILLFEPNRDDTEMFFTNVFSYNSRRRLAEHAYRNTLADLRDNHSNLAQLLKRHGIGIRADVVNDTERRIISGIETKGPRQTLATSRLRHALDNLDAQLKMRQK